MPPTERPLDVVERQGCDPYPIDPTTPDGAIAVTSYVWPDQAARLARLRGALALAATVPVSITTGHAIDFVRCLRLAPGSWLVIWHSVMWQYLEGYEQQAVLADLDELGSGATSAAPLVHVAFEPLELDGEWDFWVTLQTWPDVGLGSGSVVLGRAPAHGVPVTWL